MTEIRIEVIDDTKGLVALRKNWDALMEKARHISVFSSWEWMSLWWKHYGTGHDLKVLVALQEDNVVGILPLYVSRQRFSRYFNARILRLVGSGGDTSPDYLGPILGPGIEEAVCSRFAEYLLRVLDIWDVSNFTDILNTTPFHAALLSACRMHGLSFQDGIPGNIQIFTLPSNWKDYLASIPRERRYRHNSRRRKLTEKHAVRFFAWESTDTLDQAIDKLIALHRLRWQDRPDDQSFRSPEYLGFHREVIRICHERGWIRLYCLEIDGAISAIYYCYLFREELLYYQAGFDPAYEKYRPGHVLLGFIVEEAINQQYKVFDFLKGQYSFKSEWANGIQETRSLIIYRRTLPALVYRSRYDTLPFMKRMIFRCLGIRR